MTNAKVLSLQGQNAPYKVRAPAAASTCLLTNRVEALAPGVSVSKASSAQSSLARTNRQPGRCPHPS